MYAEKKQQIHAEEGKLTAQIKRLIRSATSISFRFQQIRNPELFNRDLCDVEILLTTEKPTDDFGVRRATTTTISGFSGWIRAGAREKVDAEAGAFGHPAYSREDNVYDPSNGFWTLADRTTFRSIVRYLPANTKLCFDVDLDWLTSASLVSARWHHDVLQMRCFDGTAKSVGEFQIATEVCTNPAWRFGAGSPSQKDAVVKPEGAVAC